MRLYDLTDNYKRVVELLESTDDREALQDTLDSLEEAFDDKVESIVKLMRSKITEHNAVKEESERLSARVAKMAKEIDWLENYVESQMIATGREKVKSTLFDIKLGLCPPAVRVLNESDIPDTYFTFKPAVSVLDKRSLLESLKNGEVIPGAEMIQRKSLRI